MDCVKIVDVRVCVHGSSHTCFDIVVSVCPVENR